MSLHTRYLAIQNSFGDLLEVTDFSVASWLALGAALQLVSLSCLPLNISKLLPLLYLSYCIIRTIIYTRRLFTGSFLTVKRGRWTAEVPEPKDPTATSDGVLCSCSAHASISSYTLKIAVLSDILQSFRQACVRQRRN